MKSSTMAALMLGCLLAGCASTPPPRPDPQALTELMGMRFAGKPVQVMMSRYGAPLRETKVGSETVYSWERSTIMYFRTQPPMPVKCQLDAYVRSDGIVRTVGLSGQNGACPLFE